MEFPIYSTKHKDCPPDSFILCGTSTLGRGLCVPTRSDCKTRKQSSRSILTTSSGNAGKNYGYMTDFLGKGCYVPTSSLKIDYQQTYTEYDTIPDTFNVMTYNIWGLSNKEKLIKLFKLRKPLLLKTLTESNADMFCLQEMSKESYHEMKDWIAKYPFASEVPFPSNKVERHRNVEVYFVSKYRPMKITIYGIEGVLGYENSFMVIEYPNLVIFNLYSQAGSKHSIGQEQTWIHYSRCRYDILNIVYDMIPHDKSSILCGDINFDLDGSLHEWPELKMINKFKKKGFIDTYRQLHKTGGLTEDTDLNLMRWNQKLAVKKYRYDAIFYRPIPKKSSILSSKLIGEDLHYLNEEDSKWFYEEVSEARKHGGMDRLKGVRTTKKGFQIPINASDHFGVLTSIRHTSSRPTRKHRR